MRTAVIASLIGVAVAIGIGYLDRAQWGATFTRGGARIACRCVERICVCSIVTQRPTAARAFLLALLDR